MSDYLGQLIARSFDQAETLRPRPVALFEPSQPATGLPAPPDEVPVSDRTSSVLPPTAPPPPHPVAAPLHAPVPAPPSVGATPTLRPPLEVHPLEAPPVHAPPPREAPLAPEPSTTSEPQAPPSPSVPPTAPQTLLSTAPRVVEHVTETVRPAPPPATVPPVMSEVVRVQPTREIITERIVEAKLQPPPPAAPSPRGQTLLPADAPVIDHGTEPPRAELSRRQPSQPPPLPPDLHDLRSATEVRPAPSPSASTSRAAAKTTMVIQPRVEAPREQATMPPSSPPPSPTIHVTIGRVEVRASSPSPPSRRPRPQPAVMSLDEYLEQRASGGSR